MWRPKRAEFSIRFLHSLTVQRSLGTPNYKSWKHIHECDECVTGVAARCHSALFSIRLMFHISTLPYDFLLHHLTDKRNTHSHVNAHSACGRKQSLCVLHNDAMLIENIRSTKRCMWMYVYAYVWGNAKIYRLWRQTNGVRGCSLFGFTSMPRVAVFREQSMKNDWSRDILNCGRYTQYKLTKSKQIPYSFIDIRERKFTMNDACTQFIIG